MVQPRKTAVNLLEGRRTGVNHWQPEIVHGGCREAGGIVLAFGAEVDDGTDSLALQSYDVMIEHERTTEEKGLVDNIPPVQRME